ncbi:hypothetical protein M125_2141 [Bacteroides fragilis str. 3998T(B)3]|uniref:Uncharacterized protein n=1 Tax=Bacteroides fragilis str. 3998T(B)3 TaxID=1339316 RepID=A0A015U372_BACFG|nr:hypothetical protein M125_2141 [Bacteroides fragilis str. 3998T(B)3]EXY96026.1 hypothetical protein M081_1814 [Bacteroides fragilis str. 3998 T(B) 4]
MQKTSCAEEKAGLCPDKQMRLRMSIKSDTRPCTGIPA